MAEDEVAESEECTEEVEDEEPEEEVVQIDLQKMAAGLFMGPEPSPMFTFQFGEMGMQVWPTADKELVDDLLKIAKTYIKKHIAAEEAQYCSEMGEDTPGYA